MNKKILVGIGLFLLAAAVLAFNPPAALIKALSVADVTAIYAKKSYAEMLASLPEKPVAEADGDSWRFLAPDGSASFAWDSGTGAAGQHAALMRAPAEPFLRAGADPAKLPAGMLRDGMLNIALDSAGRSAAKTGASPAESFADLIDANRERIGYHFQLGHFGLDLGGGNLLEWAGDPVANSLDLVFVLDPEVFLGAGVDKDRVDGWLFGSVVIHDAASGRKVEVPKFLKPFNLR
ncbi:MAG: hypothetical protein LBU23_00315 [Planctomycetota bacterium]|jgi:hypothetical protein|nr:hypothetical protein [Planctomycetota bacterium]